jgi:hypothetical protein
MSDELTIELEVELIDLATIPGDQARAITEARRKLFEKWFTQTEQRAEEGAS